MAFTENSRVKDVLASPKAVAVLERHFPGVSRNPLIGMFSNRTLRSIASMPQLKMDDATFRGLLAEINAAL